jgi:hypothetical protein
LCRKTLIQPLNGDQLKPYLNNDPERYMQLSAVFLARVVFFLEVIDLNPRGAAYYPTLARALVERYGFQKYPSKLEDFDEAKGITFEQGRAGDITIVQLVIYQNGIQLDTATDTDSSEAIVMDALGWASQTLGLVYKPEMLKRKSYVSNLTFYSDAPLLQTNPVLNRISIKISKAVSENLRFPFSFQPTAIQIGHDPEAQTIPVAPFSIQRRAQTPFSENKYFSTAPVSTKIHLSLIEEYEKSVIGDKTVSQLGQRRF